MAKQWYCGDVIVVTRQRLTLTTAYRGKNRPTKAQMEKILKDRAYEDIHEEQILDVLDVEDVGENRQDEFDDGGLFDASDDTDDIDDYPEEDSPDVDSAFVEYGDNE